LLRESRQAAKLRVSVDGIVRIEELMADGVLVALARGVERDRGFADSPLEGSGFELPVPLAIILRD
jgi:NAD+ kinase